jgi:hypothetical protein
MSVKEKEVLGKYWVWQAYLDTEQNGSNECHSDECHVCTSCGSGGVENCEA